LPDTEFVSIIMKRINLKYLIIATILIVAVVLLVKNSLPDKKRLITTRITIDSVHVAGPVVRLFDNKTRQVYWFKTLTTFSPQALDSLK
jgi:hypothetical protein